MLTVAQVEDAIRDHVFRWEYKAYKTGENTVAESSGWEQWECREDPADIPGLGTVRVIENVGGEGEGSHIHMVFNVNTPAGVRWFKKTGYYASHDGCYWDGGFSEVTPAVKTVTVYE